MKQNVKNVLLSTDNVKKLNTLATATKQDVKKAKSLMWYVNNLNRLYRKNEYVNNTNIREFGNELKTYCINHGIEVDAKTPFNVRMFTKVNEVSCYKKTIHRKAGKAFAIDTDIIVWCPVVLSENGLINTYKYLINIDKKAIDNAAREHNREINRVNRKATTAAKKELKKQQEEARELYNRGAISLEEFANIMAKVA